MEGFLATSVSYDVQMQDGGKSGSSPMNPFAGVIEDLKRFLDKAMAVWDEFQQSEEEFLREAVQIYDDKLKADVHDTFSVISSLATSLLPKIQGNEPLPFSDLTKLNNALLSGDSRYPYAGAKSDAIPDQLLKAEQGSKLYGSLSKKVESVCKRSLQELEQKEIAAFRTWLLAGGHDDKFDARRSKAESIRSQKLENLQLEYVEALSHSDHLPLYESLEGAGPQVLHMMVWNVMEFPKLHCKAPVMDGVTPYCDMVLRAIERKGALEKQLLLDAMTSESVIRQHSARVVKAVSEALESEKQETVLLQEINSDSQNLLAETCKQKGWHAHFSSSNDDASKCDAITAVISTRPFDEETQVEVVENKKVRYFAAVRQQSTWVVSCHVPLVNSKKAASGHLEDNAYKVLEQLATRFLSGDEGRALVAGGDWNSNVYEVAERASSASLAGCSSVRLHAPKHETCFGSTATIDGVIMMC